MAIHVAIPRKVKPGCGRAFEERLREFFQKSLSMRMKETSFIVRINSEGGKSR